MKKLRAFTIIEMTVSMMIASIVIVIAYTAFRLINQSYINYDLKNKAIAEEMLARKLLSRDFLDGRAIFQTETGISVISKEGAISYKFAADNIVRNQFGLRSDTIDIRVAKFLCQFEGNTCEYGQAVDKLTLYTTRDRVSNILTFCKFYSSEELYR